MLNHSTKCRHKLVSGLVLMACSMIPVAQAQTQEQILRGVIDTVTPGRNRDKATPAPAVTAGDMLGSRVETTKTPHNVLYPTRKQLLKATRAGELAGLSRASPDDKKRLVESVQRILAMEYQVPPISQECAQHWFPSDVFGLLSEISDAKISTLDDQPPEFTTPANYQTTRIESIDRRLANLQNPRDPTTCDSRALGRVVPHPYKAALVSLAGNFAKATQNYVDHERARRVAQHQEVQAQANQRQATVRAAEQQRIDAEAARVRAAEQRRADKEKARIGG